MLNTLLNFHSKTSLTNLFGVKFYFLGGLALLGVDFTKNQLPDVAIQREHSWGSNVINRTCYEQWVALACRLGMTDNGA